MNDDGNRGLSPVLRFYAPWGGTAAGIDAVRPQRNRLPATVRRSLDFLAGRLADYRADAAAERTAW